MSERDSSSGLTIHDWANIHDIASSQFRTCGHRRNRDQLDGLDAGAKAKVLSIHEWANIHNIASSYYRSCNLHGIREELEGRKPIAQADVEVSDEEEAFAREVDAELDAEESAPLPPADDAY